MDRKIRNRYNRRLLLDKISNKYKRLKLLTKQLEMETNILNDSTIWMKGICILYSINITIISYVKKNSETPNKKLDSLCKKKQKEDGIKENLNNTIWDLTSRTLSNDEYQVLRYGLNHGLATHQKETDILANAESIWDQINRNNVCKESNNHVERAKNSLRAMAFSLIDLENKQIFKDKKKLDIIKNLRKELVILKPDQGDGIVLLNANGYYNGIKKLFQDKLKFKQILEDPNPSSLTSVQRYLKKFNKRSELRNDTYDKIQPISAKLARAHGLPKIHKLFKNIPLFRPIIDTTGTTHYSVGKYLSELLNSLTHNDYSLKDSFDAATRLSRILPQVRENDDYMFISLNVSSLFTKLLSKKTVNIILKRIYNEKKIPTSLCKRLLKKLILGACQKISYLLSREQIFHAS